MSKNNIKQYPVADTLYDEGQDVTFVNYSRFRGQIKLNYKSVDKFK